MNDPWPLWIMALDLDLFSAQAAQARLINAGPRWSDWPSHLMRSKLSFLPIRPTNQVQVGGELAEHERLSSPLGLRPALERVSLPDLDTFG